MNTQVVGKYFPNCQETDDKSFHFNLQSKNNRLDKPMKFEIKDLKRGGIWLIEKSDDYLITLGNIYLCKENYKNESYCEQYEDCFNYHGIENALCGKTTFFGFDDYNGESFTTKRILVVQME